MLKQIINLEELLDESDKRLSSIAATVDEGISSNLQLGQAKVEMHLHTGFCLALQLMANGCAQVPGTNLLNAKAAQINQGINMIQEAIEAYKK